MEGETARALQLCQVFGAEFQGEIGLARVEGDLPRCHRHGSDADARQVQVDQLANPLHRPDLEVRRQPLAQFLADGPPPVFIGFGSSQALDADFMLDTARRAGVRVVIQGAEDLEEPDALGIGTVPHEWLFPQMAAVVHHAGAGTTAAGLRAGAPTVGVPIFTDQPFWASRVSALGAGPQPVPYKNLGIDALSAAITQAVGDARFAQNAARISKLLAAEDSVAPVAAALRLV